MDDVKCNFCGARKGFHRINDSTSLVILKCDTCNHTFAITATDAERLLETDETAGNGSPDGGVVLKRKPVPPRPPGGYELPCINHLEYAAMWECAECDILLCDLCAESLRNRNVVVRVCPRCKRHLVNTKVRKTLVPFWNDIRSIIEYPLKPESRKNLYDGLLFFGIFGLAVGLVSFLYVLVQFNFPDFIVGFFSTMGMFLVWFLVIFGFFLYVHVNGYLSSVVLWSARGDFRLPIWWHVEVEMGDRILLTILALVCRIMYFIPVTVYVKNRLSAGDGFIHVICDPLTIFFLFIATFTAPMIFMMTSVHESPFAAINQIALFRGIYVIRKEYCIAYGLILFFLLITSVVSAIVSIIPVIGVVVSCILGFYMSLVIAHLLGYMVLQCRDVLAWVY